MLKRTPCLIRAAEDGNDRPTYSFDRSPPARAATARAGTALPGLPAYLEDNCWWAYLRPVSLAVFDHPPVVSAILWGWYTRLASVDDAERAR